MKRLQSLDALRGFDMFWIIGGGGIFAGLASLQGWEVWWKEHYYHVDWHGFALEDMIFPLFLFIAGISFPFSMAKRLEGGVSRKSLYMKIISRGLLLVLFGMIYNGLLKFDFSNMRYASVLGRIGLAWMFAALIFVNTDKRNVRVLWCAGLLVFYWLLLAFVPAFDNPGASRFSMEGNFTSYFDRLFLPGKFYKVIHDPEGWLGVIPATATAMLGMLTGQFVMWRREGLTEYRRIGYMVITGIILVAVGLLWDIVFPINKNLWTSSFVCFVGGLSLLLFSLFYLIIDVWECRKWSFFFTVIGMNSITIYMACKMIKFSHTSNFLFGGMIGLFPPSWELFLNNCALVAVCWAFLYFLHRQKIFLRI
jgi:predicted acyltransferase